MNGTPAHLTAMPLFFLSHHLASKECTAPRLAELSLVLLVGMCERRASDTQAWVSTSCLIQVSDELRWEQQPPIRRGR